MYIGFLFKLNENLNYELFIQEILKRDPKNKLALESLRLMNKQKQNQK